MNFMIVLWEPNTILWRVKMLFSKKYKKGMTDAAKAYKDFGDKQENAIEAVLQEVRNGNATISDAVQSLKGNIDNLYSYLKSKEKADLYTVYTPFDIKNLDENERLFLVGALVRLTSDKSPTEEQQNYLRSIQKYLEIKEPPLGVDLTAIENIENINVQKAIYQSVLEYLILQDGDSYDETELQQEFLDSFNLNPKNRISIAEHVEVLYSAAGALGLAEKYGYIEGIDELEIKNIEDKYKYAVELFNNCEFNKAYPLLQELSANGYSKSNALLYWCEYDMNESPDVFNAKKWCQKGYQEGDDISTMLYALFVENDNNSKIKICEEVKQKLEKSASSGDAFSQYILGIYYINDVSKNQDFSKAFFYFNQSAQNGFYRSFYTIALRYLWGEGVEKNISKAMFWLEKIETFPQYVYKISEFANKLYDNQDYNNAATLFLKYNKITGKGLVDLSIIYYYGQGVEKDFDKAFYYANEAIGKSERMSHAYVALGNMYLTGNGAQLDKSKAFNCFLLSSEMGDKVGICTLAACHQFGWGTEINIELAKKYYSMSADKGYQPAIDALNKLN